MFRCQISGCNATGYEGYIWEDEERTKSCKYEEAVPDENGMCVRANTSDAVVVRTCKDGPYEFDDFDFDRTSITQFHVLCDNENVFRSVRHHPDSTTCH